MSAFDTVPSSAPRYCAKRRMNAAIWPRVTPASGQKLSLSGGLQPDVTPAPASHSMSASKIDPSSSLNVSLDANTATGIADTTSSPASTTNSFRFFFIGFPFPVEADVVAHSQGNLAAVL
ncbi:hypothetical protein BMS3Bbin02_01815 [bacterium BMS3Bbin02]|nr:hypothetical protein BMS3Bbin02_01815 [bacterium BMS3Bbin02]